MINSTSARNALDAIADAHDDFADALRELLIDPTTTPDFIVASAADALRFFIDALDREALTTLLLDYSLCPLHRIDYAICFDDELAECAAIRTIHPTHDT